MPQAVAIYYVARKKKNKLEDSIHTELENAKGEKKSGAVLIKMNVWVEETEGPWDEASARIFLCILCASSVTWKCFKSSVFLPAVTDTIYDFILIIYTRVSLV